MKIADLSNLVIIRNHLASVISDVSITSKNDIRELNELRRSMDKKFVECVKKLDLDCLFEDSSKEWKGEGITSLDQKYPVEWLKIDTTISKEDIEKWKKAFFESNEKEGQTFKVDQPINEEEAAKWKAAFEAAGPKLAVAPTKQLSLPFDNSPKPKKSRKKTNDKG